MKKQFLMTVLGGLVLAACAAPMNPPARQTVSTPAPTAAAPTAVPPTARPTATLPGITGDFSGSQGFKVLAQWRISSELPHTQSIALDPFPDRGYRQLEAHC